MTNTSENVRELLVDSLESYFGRHYMPKQRDTIVEKFLHKTDAQLVALYDAVIEKLDRLPLLSKIMDIDAVTTKRNDYEPASFAANHSLPWEQRAIQARKDAETYATGFMNNQPIAMQAQSKGWTIELRAFVQRWAEEQAKVTLGSRNGFGWSPEMLGIPCDEEEKERRLQEMISQIVTARSTGRIDVTVPQWFIDSVGKRHHTQKPKEQANA